jgi:hypothetical protein
LSAAVQKGTIGVNPSIARSEGAIRPNAAPIPKGRAGEATNTDRV